MGWVIVLLFNVVGIIVSSYLLVLLDQPHWLVNILDPWHAGRSAAFSAVVDLPISEVSTPFSTTLASGSTQTAKTAESVVRPLLPSTVPDNGDAAHSERARVPESMNGGIQPAASGSLVTSQQVPSLAFPVSVLSRDLACSGFPSPSVAICIHGSARSFTHIVVQRTLRENLVDPLGANATVFAHITRLDSRGDPFHKYNGLFEPPTEESIRKAAAFLAVDFPNLIVLEGPNVELPNCSSYEENFQVRRNVTARNPNYHVYSMDHLLSLAGQISHRHGCMELIGRHESKVGTKFDYVVSARADLSVYIPMAPSCLFDPSNNYGLGDWFFSTTRQAAEILNWEPYEQFYNCSKNLRLGGNVDEYIAPFQRRVHMASYPWTVMIVREDGPRFPTGMCNRFHNPMALPHDPHPGEPECKRFTSSNPYNREEVQGEVLPSTAAQLSCASTPQPQMAVCLHGSLRSELPDEVSLLREQHLGRPLGTNMTFFLHLVTGGGGGGGGGEGEENASGAFEQAQTKLQARLHVAAGHAKFPVMAEAGVCGKEPQAISELLWHRDQCMTMIEESGKVFDIVVMLKSSVVPVVGLKPYCMYNWQQPRRYLDMAYVARPEAFRQAIDQWKAVCSGRENLEASLNLNETMLSGDFLQDDGFAMGYYSPRDPCLLYQNLPLIYRQPWRKLPSQIRSNPFNEAGPTFTCNRKNQR